MGNFLENDSFRQSRLLESAIWDELTGDDIGWYQDVEVFWAEDDAVLQVFPKGAADEGAVPLKEFYVDITVSEQVRRTDG